MNERIKQIIDYYKLSTRQFEQKISVSNGVIAKVLTQNTCLRSDVLSKIADTFPSINLDWLLLGRGEMLRNDSSSSEKIYRDILAEKDLQLFEAHQTIGALRQENSDLRKKLKSASATAILQ